MEDNSYKDGEMSIDVLVMYLGKKILTTVCGIS